MKIIYSLALSLIVTTSVQAARCDGTVRRMLTESLEMSCQLARPLELETTLRAVEAFFPPQRIRDVNVVADFRHLPFSFEGASQYPLIDIQNRNGAFAQTSLMSVRLSPGEKRHFAITVRHYSEVFYDQRDEVDYTSASSSMKNVTESSDDTSSRIISFIEIPADKLLNWRDFLKEKSLDSPGENLEEQRDSLSEKAKLIVTSLYKWTSETLREMQLEVNIPTIVSVNVESAKTGYVATVKMRQVASQDEAAKAIVLKSKLSPLSIEAPETAFMGNQPYFFISPVTEVLKINFSSSGDFISLKVLDFDQGLATP